MTRAGGRRHALVGLAGLLALVSPSSADPPKPLVIVVDSGSLYDYLADAFQTHGLPVFRSADIAVSVLGKYIQNSLRNRTAAKAGRLPL